jgi:hypothetical protein
VSGGAAEPLRISNQVLDLTKAIHAMNLARSAGGPKAG